MWAICLPRGNLSCFLSPLPFDTDSSSEVLIRFTILSSSWRCKSSMTRLPSCHQANSAKSPVVRMSGPVVKSHISSKTEENTMQHGKPCTDRCPWIIIRFFQVDCKYLSYMVDAGLNQRLFAKSSKNTKSKYQQSTTGKPVTRFYRNHEQKQKQK